VEIGWAVAYLLAYGWLTDGHLRKQVAGQDACVRAVGGRLATAEAKVLTTAQPGRRMASGRFPCGVARGVAVADSRSVVRKHGLAGERKDPVADSQQDLLNTQLVLFDNFGRIVT